MRNSVGSKEQKVFRIAKVLGDASYHVRKCFKPQKYLTLKELLTIVKIDTSNINSQVKKNLNTPVSQVSQCGSRMTSNCVAVQFNEDSNEIAKWGAKNGALVVFTREHIDGIPCIAVENPEQIYTELCKYYRDKHPVEYVVVAGSIGKTSTKRMVNSVFSAHYKTFNDPENENQLPCIGYAVQHVPSGVQYSIQEISEDTPGCLSQMMTILSPKIAIITAIDKSHIESFGSEQAVYDEVATVIKQMPADGVAIINLDDEIITKYSIDCTIKTISINNSVADYYAKDITICHDGLHFTIVENHSKKEFPIVLNRIYAVHNIYSALYSFAAGVLSNIPYNKCIEGLYKYKTVGIRQNIYKDIRNKVTIYADCYNAVAKSVKSAIDTASNIPIKGKRIAILGDIEEAGVFSEDTHIDIIKSIENSSFDVLISYGNKLKRALDSYKTIRQIEIIALDNKKSISNWLKSNINRGDLILFKASRKSALETIINDTWWLTYRVKMLPYYWAIIKWRLTVIIN